MLFVIAMHQIHNAHTVGVTTTCATTPTTVKCQSTGRESIYPMIIPFMLPRSPSFAAISKYP